jgi:hypothetical protein
MSLAEVLFLTIIVYLAYRFIFSFLLPIVRATHQVRQQFRDMRDPAGDAQATGNRTGPTGNPTGSATGNGGAARRSPKPPADDYIDFEEVK